MAKSPTPHHGVPSSVWTSVWIGAVSMLVVAATSAPARAEEPALEPTLAPTLSISAHGGISLFTNSRSSAPPHLVKPTLRLDATLELDPRLAFGVELALTIADSKGYQLYGGYLLGQATLYQGDLFGLMLTWGAGLGTGPAILASDLLAESDYTLWVLVGVDMRWTVVCDWLDVMVALRSEHITVITATAGLVFRL